MKKLWSDFIKCGTIGWCMEIIVTAIDSLRKRTGNLNGHTSLLMFPIYGAACLLRPLAFLIKGLHWAFRGLIYMSCIFGAEYASGRFLEKKLHCPWDYSHSPWNIRGVIRLDYAPAWFALGLVFEHVLKNNPSAPPQVPDQRTRISGTIRS